MSAKTPLHGRTHLPNGSDPIIVAADPDVVRLNFSNGGLTDRWLLIRTGDPSPPGGLPAIYLHDDGGAGVKILAGSGGDLELLSSAGALTLAGATATLTSGAGIDIDAAGALGITAGGGATLDVVGDTVVTVLGGISLVAGTTGATSPNGILELLGYDAIQMACSVGDIGIDISNAGSPGDHCLRVTSNAASPHEIFRIDSDGTIHIQAGATIIADIT